MIFTFSRRTSISWASWLRSRTSQVFGSTVEAVKRAFTDFGRAVPEEYRSRTIGARDD